MCDDNTRYTISNTKCNKYTILVPSTPTKTISNQTKHQLHQPKYQVRQPKYQVRQAKHKVCKPKYQVCQTKHQVHQVCNLIKNKCEFAYQNIDLRCFVTRIYALFGIPFTGLKIRWRTKNDNYQVCL